MVCLRPLQAKDFVPLYRVASDASIWEQHPDKKRHTLSGFVKFFSESIKSNGALWIEDVENGKCIGSSRFKVLNDFPNAVEIGWTFLSRKYWGGTHNFAIKQLMLDHAFQYFKEVVLFVDFENVRSLKAVEKLGRMLSEELRFKKEITKGNDNITYRFQKKHSD
ncbi:GNAT family N-acetyltransferase [Flagellimonas allohymeniacidonis]|nr:GNAT family N-acetyltransferase [Allomuricauda hymeniacidonis]